MISSSLPVSLAFRDLVASTVTHQRRNSMWVCESLLAQLLMNHFPLLNATMSARPSFYLKRASLKHLRIPLGLWGFQWRRKLWKMRENDFTPHKHKHQETPTCMSENYCWAMCMEQTHSWCFDSLLKVSRFLLISFVALIFFIENCKTQESVKKLEG